MPDNPSRRSAALLWIFVASGCAGLIYQSVWTQYLGLFLGHAAYAQSLVLMLFMGGMALGAWLVSRHSEHLRKPLMYYAAIELAIGIAGLVFHQLYDLSTRLAYDNLFPMLGDGSVGIVRWALSIALVFPQCVLLGATFPLMSAGFLRLRPASDNKVISGLYFTNSIGAAAGALVATYLLLPRIGLPGAILTAGILNILVALAVYPAAKHEPGTAASSVTRHAHEYATPNLILIAAAITGLTSFVYEIAWVRMLSLALGTTIHAFELMLAAFISGIAFGGLWLSRNGHRIHSPLRAVGWVQVWMGVAALSSMFIYANAFEWVGWLMRVLTKTNEGYTLYNVASGIISLLVMFPAAFFAGMTLPLLTIILLRSGAGERSIGRVYAANTLGAIAGVLLAVHALLPLVGLKLSLWVAAAVDMALGVVLLKRSTFVQRLHPRPTAIAAVIAVVALISTLSFVRFDPLTLASSVYRTGLTSLGEGTRMIFYRDGKTASIAAYAINDGTKDNWAISTNGKVDAALAPTLDQAPSSDESTMTLLAALPLALMPNLEHVGVIGFGSGMTTHTLLGSQRVGRVDTVEIEPMMVEGARTFHARVHRAFDDPRSHIIYDDAKTYFSSENKHYDLIISEPSNPWMGGTASLFSEEFYRFIPRHLKTDGLFVQWLQLYEIDPTLVSSVLRAMLPRFKDVNAYIANSGDLIMVASPEGQVPPMRNLLEADAGLSRELERVGMHKPIDLQDFFVLNKKGLEAYADMFPTQSNSDFFPILQLRAPQSRFKQNMVQDMSHILNAAWPISKHLGGLPARPLDSVIPSGKREITTDKKLHAAREIRAALVDGHGVEGIYTHQIDAMQLEALRGLSASCGFDRMPAQSAQIMYSLAVETIPFLDRKANQDLWITPKWLDCAPTHPLVVDTLALLEATASNNSKEVLEIGQRLLDGPDAEFILSNSTAAYYIWGALHFSAIQDGRPDLSKELDSKYGKRIPEQVQSQATIRFLRSLARLEDKANVRNKRDAVL